MGLFDKFKDGFEALAKALGESEEDGEDIPFDKMRDALVRSGLAEPTEEKPRALFHDPYAVTDWGGWRERPSSMTYETLRMMSVKNTVIASIIQIRCNQVAQFGRPQQGPYDKGYRIIPRDRRDKKKVLTPAEKKQAAEIERMLETTGFLLPGEKPADRDSFRTFLRKATRDILTYDQWAFEKIRDRKGRVSRFIALPSESIRPASADIEHMDVKSLRERVSHVQVYEDTPIAEFSPEDIAWCVMNPRSDLRANGFGFSYIEMLVSLVTAWLYGFEYNQRFFMQGSAIKGILNVKGAIPDRQLRAFRRMWYSMVSGVSNAWKTPILNSEDLQWVPLHVNNREMEYGQWMDWLTKLTCAVFGIDPVEINFIFGNSGQSSSLNQSRPNAAEVQESKDKGLVPLMDHIADNLNMHIIWELAPDFEFAFTGFDAQAEEKEQEGRIKAVTNYKMIDEVRALYEDDPLPNGMGQLILNPTYMQWAMQKEQAAMGGPPGGGEGDMGMGDPDALPSTAPGNDEEDLAGPPQKGPPKPGQPPKGPQGPQPPKGAQKPPGKPFGSPGEEALQASAFVERTARGILRKSRVHTRTEGGREIIDIELPEDPT
jgi:hypothetical protein